MPQGSTLRQNFCAATRLQRLRLFQRSKMAVMGFFSSYRRKQWETRVGFIQRMWFFNSMERFRCCYLYMNNIVPHRSSLRPSLWFSNCGAQPLRVPGTMTGWAGATVNTVVFTVKLQPTDEKTDCCKFKQRLVCFYVFLWICLSLSTILGHFELKLTSIHPFIQWSQRILHTTPC